MRPQLTGLPEAKADLGPGGGVLLDLAVSLFGGFRV